MSDTASTRVWFCSRQPYLLDWLGYLVTTPGDIDRPIAFVHSSHSQLAAYDAATIVADIPELAVERPVGGDAAIIHSTPTRR